MNMCEEILTPPRGRKITLAEAVGTVLSHDITEIRPAEYKGPAFKKGHVVAEADLEHLARLGKRHLFVLDIPPDMMHEDEAVAALAEALAGENVKYDPNPSEGKINLLAAVDGILKVDVAALTEFNMVEGIMCASRHTNSVVSTGDCLAGTRAIPLVIAREAVERAVAAARKNGPVFSVRPLSRPLTGLIVTGNEVYTGLIQDKSAPIISRKLETFSCPLLRATFAPDDPDVIAAEIKGMIDDGAELVIATGGMSVDPDDVTRLGVARAGARDILYGCSVLPGAMLLVARVGDVPVIGVPACAIFHERTIFDLVFPRILAGEVLTRRDLASLGHGGMCLNCEVCRFPVCSFGKGV